MVRPHSNVRRTELGVLFLVRAILCIGIVASMTQRAWLTAFVAGLSLALTFVPLLLRRWRLVDLPLPFEVAGAVLVLLSMFLGNLHGYYTRFWWWDSFLHGTSAIVIGIAGYLLLSVLLQATRSHTSPWLVGVFTVCFALAIGALWEIFEFTMDTSFGMNLQVRQTGVVDTMGDLIMDALGALIAGIAAGLHTRGIAGWGLLSGLRKTFRSNNSDLFRRRPPKRT